MLLGYLSSQLGASHKLHKQFDSDFRKAKNQVEEAREAEIRRNMPRYPIPHAAPPEVRQRMMAEYELERARERLQTAITTEWVKNGGGWTDEDYYLGNVPD
jgi:hypothetical protein